MRQSQLFTRISKSLPKDETSYNAQVLIRAGFVDKVGAGIYTFLPLGLRVHNKICNIIREEINKIGGQEILMPGLTPKEVWDATDRWSAFDALFKLKGSDSKEYALGATHEEIVTPLAKKHIFSYKELPAYIYQIQTKFRNEKRAKAGLIRGREFSMKDLYSFHADEEDLNEYYKKVQKAYFKIFERCGLLDLTYLTFASGGAFSKYSHEFQTLTDAGEDKIFICEECQIAINKEIINEQDSCPNCGNKELKEENAVEVGNIFKLKTRFSDPFNFLFKDKDGNDRIVEMGCYGIGPSRIIGTIVEVFHDNRGIMWPAEVAPFKVHLLKIGQMDDSMSEKVEKIYNDLISSGVDVLYDDREISAGEKFAEADLLGCPFRAVLSEKTLKSGTIELKRRNSDELRMVKIEDFVKLHK